MKLKKYVLLSFAALLTSIGVAAAAIPGPQRAIAPQYFGLHEIAPNVFTDDNSRAEEWLQLRDAANLKVQNFFGELESKPRYILCSTIACEHIFGKNGNVAQTYGWSLIHVPPKALTEKDVGLALLTHERVHAELVYRWGASAIWDEKIPSWFNEGLATFVSQDKRVEGKFTYEQLSWVRGSKSFWDWNRFVSERGFWITYGAANENVAALNRAIGHNGLMALVNRSLAGEGFENVEARLLVH